MDKIGRNRPILEQIMKAYRFLCVMQTEFRKHAIDLIDLKANFTELSYERLLQDVVPSRDSPAKM